MAAVGSFAAVPRNASGDQYGVVYPRRGHNTWFLHRDFVAHARSPNGVDAPFAWRVNDNVNDENWRL